jgi:pimeloyl-ACP methyl ester carboxylesterase
VLLLQADPRAGGMMTDEEVTQALASLSGLTHVKFPGLSHLMNYEDPAGVAGAIVDFLAQFSGSE